MFDKLTQKPPEEIKQLSITLQWRQDVEEGSNYMANYEFTLVDKDGLHVHDPIEQGDLIPYLSPQEIQAAKAFVNAQLTKVKKRIS